MYLYYDLNEEMKNDDGQKSIDIFLRASKDMIAGEENFFICDRFTRKVIGVQKMYFFLLYLKDILGLIA